MARSQTALDDDRRLTERAWESAVKHLGAASPPEFIDVEGIDEPVPLARILDPIHGLSMKMRLRIALIEISKHRQEIADRIDVSINSISDWRNLKKDFDTEPKNFGKFLTYFVEVARSPKRGIGRSEFRDDNYTHHDAPQKFATWLRTGIKEAGDGLELLRRQAVYPWYSTRPRKKDLNALAQSLLDPKGPVISVVHTDYTANGLTAFAEELIWKHLRASPKQRPPNICYLPLHPAHAPKGPITYAQVLGWILAFVEGRSMIGAEPVPVGSMEVDAINFIRTTLATDPAIFIFDGHSVDLPSMPDLEAVITGAPLPDIIRQIAHPSIPEDSPAGVSDNLSKTRMVVLSSHPFPARTFMESTQHIAMKAPPITAYNDIFSQLELKNAHAITDRLPKKFKPFDETVMALFDAILSYQADAPRDLLKSDANTLGVELIESVFERHSVDFMILLLLTTAFGRLRVQTAIKLAQQHSKLAQNIDENEYGLKDRQLWSREEILAALDRLKGIIVLSEDVASPSLDKGAHPGEEITAETESLAAAYAEIDLTCFEFRSPSLRAAVRAAILDHLPAKSIALTHRLIAEESLKQHAIILRHSATMDISSIRYHGRLLQALYHAMLATAADPNEIDALQDSHALVLPAEPTEAFTSALFRIYMGGLESPPNWTLSREFGAERIRRDFLLLALNTAPGSELTELEQKLLGQTPLGVKTPDWFAGSGGNAGLAIKELLLNFVRSAMHIHDLEPAQDALNAARGLANDYPEIDLGEIDKLETDLDLIKNTLTQARMRIDARLDALLGATTDSVLDGLVASILKEDRESATAACEKAIHALAQRFYVASKQQEVDLLDIADYLNRRAEIEGQIADQQTAESEGEEFALEGFLRAFIAFSTVNRILYDVFAANPVAPIRYTHAHSSRIFIRVCVVLRRYASSDKCPKRGVPNSEYFQIAARREANMLLRDVHRHPTERAALLILEAVFYRTAIGGDARQASKMLQAADLHMVRAADRVRLRARFYFERIKISRKLAEFHFEKNEIELAQAHLRDATYDKERLEMLTEALSPSYWDNLCATQVEKLESLAEKLEV